MHPNKDFIIQSLQVQLSQASLNVAQRDAIITEQKQQLDELKKELEQSRKKQIEEMDNAE
ncbi:hypothetical protein JUJ52_02685 [Virgibacillus sp. AGTR]|uniref:hypothetical protein n=1 Tax=Virgibacillus sp. AGTR TaxID=2812055 RepID=UPI001D16FB19|nr:hypothetical protein [Virgibacillus sp. AGTR]MCC2248866.1 hypothetical protein [Virgibacillus sp. AGTR]